NRSSPPTGGDVPYRIRRCCDARSSTKLDNRLRLSCRRDSIDWLPEGTRKGGGEMGQISVNSLRYWIAGALALVALGGSAPGAFAAACDDMMAAAKDNLNIEVAETLKAGALENHPNLPEHCHVRGIISE